VITLLLEDCNGFTRTAAAPMPPAFYRVPNMRRALGDFTVEGGEALLRQGPAPWDMLVFRRIQETDKDVWLYKEQFT